MQILDRLIRSGDGFDGHDPTMIVGHQIEVIVATIARRSGHDHTVIGPLSRSNRATIASISLPPFDEDRAVASRSCVR